MTGVFPAKTFMVLMLMLLLMGGLLMLSQAPLTLHSAYGHLADQWTSEMISLQLDTGHCPDGSPVQSYECKAKDYKVEWCRPSSGSKTVIGRIIGMTVRQVVTAFEARMGYWTDKEGRCR